ncbi:MAG: phosphatidate cytidylyltransferase [Gammaproteobacteria bacterium]|nr:phosphatidate cytidylyltransferase [Gammaproteobacteria bacterium]
MLWQRVVTALALIPLVIGGLFFLAPVYLGLVMVVVIAIGGWEWARLACKPTRVQQGLFAACFATLTLVVLSVGGVLDDPAQLMAKLLPLWQLSALWWLVAVIGVLIFPRGRRLWRHRTALTLAGLFTLIPFSAALVAIAAFEHDSQLHLGPKLLLATMVVVWCADSGAYFAGRRFGKRKLSPAVSPGKTWEGFFGGMAAALAAAMVAVVVLNLPMADGWPFVGAACAAAVISVFGDLSESMFKRMAGIKDSGRILPGHGGLLDRVDSLCAALPLFALCYLWLGGV